MACNNMKRGRKMVKHVILWNLKDEFDDEKKNEIKKGIKEIDIN